MQHCPDTESQWVLATAGHHPFTAIEELDENDEGIPINRNHRKKRYGIADEKRMRQIKPMKNIISVNILYQH